jgi:hypothetical protein
VIRIVVIALAFSLICVQACVAQGSAALTATQIGPLSTGMSPAEVEALNLPIVRDEVFTEGDPYPRYIVDIGAGQTVEVLFWNGRAFNLQTASANMATVRGARVGMSLAELRDLYPDGKVNIGDAEGWYFNYQIERGAMFLFDVSGLADTCFEYRGDCPDLSDRRANVFVAIHIDR